MSKQKGLSLVELLVAVALSLVIIGGIIQVFTANRQAYNLPESMIRVQESGRFALEFISEAIRSSGSYGCLPSASTETEDVQSLMSGFSDFNAIQTAAFTTGTTAPNWVASSNGATASTSTSVGSTDRLSLLHLTTDEYVVSSVPTTSSLVTSTSNDFSVSTSSPDYVMVSNCEVADIGYVSSIDSSTNTVTLNDTMRDTTFKRTDVRSTIAKLQHLSFTVDEANDNLTVQVNGNGAQTVIGGIESIQFEYGVDTGTDLVPDYYADIASIVTAGDEADITAVKISVLAVSGTTTEGAALNMDANSQSVNFDNTSITLGDGRYRAVFESTVVLRNRMN